jgi:hypothetical protein
MTSSSGALAEGRSEVDNQYRRVVQDEGNRRALGVIAETMELRTTFEWRGLGPISQSALKLRGEFEAWDAEVRYEVPGVRVADPKACQCGEVLKGVIKPLGVQGVRDGLHARPSDRDLHGVERRGLRRLLQLRALRRETPARAGWRLNGGARAGNARARPH